MEIPELVDNQYETKLLVINETATKYTITFETDAPYTVEEEQITDDMYNKTVTVAHNSSLHYTVVPFIPVIIRSEVPVVLNHTVQFPPTTG